MSEQIDDERERQVLTAWTALTNDVQRLCGDQWAQASAWQGLNTDPAAFAMVLFKRSYGHLRAFSRLYSDHLYCDADGCARSAVEAAICLANLAIRREAFIDDLRSDAVATAKGQIPIWAEHDPEFGKGARAQVQSAFGDRRADGTAHKKLDMSTVAEGAGLPQLYAWYRHFSGTRVHVTGLSVLADFTGVDDPDFEHSAQVYERLRHIDALATAGGATVIACEAHAKLIGFDDFRQRAVDLMGRMSALGPADIFADRA